MTAIRIIIADIAIFLALKGIWLFAPEDTESVVGTLALPSSLPELARAPWSVLSYMFVHIDFWHLLVNTLWLAWVGTLLERIAGTRFMTACFIAGGAAGAVCYILLPHSLSGAEPAWLLGASAAIFSVTGATLVSTPDKRMEVPLLGAISLKLIACIGAAIFLCASIEMTAAQTAAHAGGLTAGIISAAIWKSLSRCKTEAMKALARERIAQMALIEKARRSGYASLSRNEQLKLFNLTDKRTMRDDKMPQIR